MISELEEDYNDILKSLEKNVNLGEGYYKFKEISENEILRLVRIIMKFQRKLEYSLESTMKLVRKMEYAERLKNIADSLFEKLSSDNQVETIEFYAYPTVGYEHITENEKVLGVISELRHSHKRFLHGDMKGSRRSCYCAYFGFKSLRSNLIEIEEELRLIGALTTYPIEKKIRLKDKLVSETFEEVAISLEEAETNVEDDHFRDCVSRCRDAVEIFVSIVKEKETGEKTEKHFASDLGKIVKYGVYDDSVKKLAQGVYSFLSLKGSHKYDKKKVAIYDAETALQQTYTLLEMLLKKYSDFKKK